MTEKNLETAVAYYTAMNNKDLNTIAQYLHSDMEFKSPLQTAKGKEKVLETIKRFMEAFEQITIRAKCDGYDYVILAYDVHLPKLGLIHTAILMHFKDKLISQIELFFDAHSLKK